MPSIEESIVSRVNSQIPTLVNKVYPLEAPQVVVPPYATYQIITTLRDQDLLGDNGVTRQRVQINIINSTYLATKALNQSVISAFKNYIGLLNGLYIQKVHIDNEIIIKSEQTHLFQGVVDLVFYYNE